MKPRPPMDSSTPCSQCGEERPTKQAQGAYSGPAYDIRAFNRSAIARVCHEVNRAYCLSLGDTSQPAWESAPEWQRQSAIKGVEFNLANPDAPPSHSHDCWLEEKRATGWKYGPVKDAEKKEHPCCVPYDELPREQKTKDYLFKATVRALASST